jgi:hypothetical protein
VRLKVWRGFVHRDWQNAHAAVSDHGGMPKPNYRLIRSGLDLVFKLLPRRLGLRFEAPDWATSRWHHFKVRALMGPFKI